MMMSTAVVVTDASTRYAKQLLSHLGHKVTVEPLADQPAPAGRLVFAYGTGTVVPQDGTLVLEAAAADAESLARVKDVHAASPGEVRCPPGIGRQLGTGGRGRLRAAESPAPRLPLLKSLPPISTAAAATPTRPRAWSRSSTPTPRRRTSVRFRRPSRPAAGSTCRPCSVPIRSGMRSRRTAGRGGTGLHQPGGDPGGGGRRADQRGAGGHRHARSAAGSTGVQLGVGRAFRRPPARPVGDRVTGVRPAGGERPVHDRGHRLPWLIVADRAITGSGRQLLHADRRGIR